MNNASFKDTLFPIVLCTQDKWRENNSVALIECFNNIAEQFSLPTIIFDNNSTYKSPLQSAHFPHILVECRQNIGYWTALHWICENISKITNNEFKYIHPIESDFNIFKLERLKHAIRFLEECPDFNTVRSQEFRVGLKHFYFKQSILPSFLKRSIVANYNGVTEEKVKFERLANNKAVYKSNWHAKVPALHRFDSFSDCLTQLKQLPTVSEHDFMRLMHQKSPNVGVLEGGIWNMKHDTPKSHGVSGSYSNEADLQAANYRNTRIDKIDTDYPTPTVRIFDKGKYSCG